jgi:ubiquitin thioesterase protein OTUB1
LFQFMEVIDYVGQGSSTFSQTDLHKVFNDQGYSDYIVVYLRLITSGQLQRDSEFYQHFIEGDRSVADFCHQVSVKTCCILTLSAILQSTPCCMQ